jgi:hypothetical protein
VTVSDKPWDGSSSRYTIARWRRACLVDHGGDREIKSNFSLPVREPTGELNRNGLAAAAGRLNQVAGLTADQRASAARQLLRLYGEAGMEPPDHLREMANRSAETGDIERRNTLARVERHRSGGGREIGRYAAVFGRESRQPCGIRTATSTTRKAHDPFYSEQGPRPYPA